MTQNEYKAGDRVCHSGNRSLTGTIKEICENYVSVLWDHHPYELCGQDFDEIESIDRKTAFLTRLQSLLREFDAAIEPEYSSYSEVGIVSIIVGSECVVESYNTITADNIMDFDKE